MLYDHGSVPVEHLVNFEEEMVLFTDILAKVRVGQDTKDLFKNNSALLQPTHGGAQRGLMM
jgi:hypothetical protein